MNNSNEASEVVETETNVGPEAAPNPNIINLIGHYVVKIYAHDDCPAEDRRRLKNAFAGLHDEVESVFSVQVEGEDWQYDIQYEVTDETPREDSTSTERSALPLVSSEEIVSIRQCVSAGFYWHSTEAVLRLCATIDALRVSSKESL